MLANIFLKKSSLFLLPLVFFLLLKNALTLSFPCAKESILFYSNQNRQDLKFLVVDLIDRATQSLTIASYHLSDPDVIAHLNHKAKQGISIRLYLDKSNKGVRKKLDPGIVLALIGAKGLMHEKLMIVDAHLSFLGSANMTRDSLMHHENIVMGVESPHLAQHLICHLENLKDHRPTPPLTLNLNNQTIQLFFCPESGSEAITTLHKSLSDSQSTLFLSMFTFTHPALLEALWTAQKRHGNCHIILDRQTARGASKKAKEWLDAHEIAPRISRSLALFHHKWALIDQNILALGSANWTRGAFEKNADYLLFLSPLTAKQKKFFESLNKRIFSQSEKI